MLLRYLNRSPVQHPVSINTVAARNWTPYAQFRIALHSYYFCRFALAPAAAFALVFLHLGLLFFFAAAAAFLSQQH